MNYHSQDILIHRGNQIGIKESTEINAKTEGTELPNTMEQAIIMNNRMKMAPPINTTKSR